MHSLFCFSVTYILADIDCSVENTDLILQYSEHQIRAKSKLLKKKQQHNFARAGKVVL